MPLTPEEISATVAELRTDTVRSAAQAAPSVSQQDMARAMQYGEAHGVSPVAVVDDLAHFDERARVEKLSRVAQSDTWLAGWLSKPEHVALAANDLDPLERLGKLFNGVTGYFRERAAVAGAGQLGALQQVGGDYAGGVVRTTREPLAVLYDIAGRQARERGDTEGATRAAAGAALFRQRTAGEAIAERGKQIQQFAREDRDRLTRGVNRPASVLDAVTRPWNTAQYYGGLFAESVPAIGLAMATRNPVAAASVMGLTTGASDYGERRAKGQGIVQATAGAVPQGGLEAALSVTPFEIAMGGGARRVLKTIAAESVSEGLTQAAQTNAADTADGAQTPVREQLLQTLDAMLVGAPGGVVEAALGTRGQAIVQAEATQREQALVSDLVAQALESTTRTAAPAQFEALVRAKAGDLSVHVPAEQLQVLFQSGALEQAQLAEWIGEPEAIDEALATGGSVAIPLSQYVTHLAEQHEALAPHIRLTPGEPVAMPTPDEIQADIAEYMKAHQAETSRADGVLGEVFDEFYGQLLPIHGDTSAATLAGLMQGYYRTLAERTGTPVETLRARFTFNINGAGTPTVGPKGIDTDVDPLLDALRTGKLPSDQEIYGERLTSALVKAGGLRNDEGGELAARDALRRPGLVTLTGMSLDEARAWAQEQGYLPPDAEDGVAESDPNAFLDLLDRDMKGEGAYRVDAQRDARLRFREDAEGLADELARAGVDLATTDNATARAALGLGPHAQLFQAGNDAQGYRDTLKAALGSLRTNVAPIRVGATPAVLRAVGVAAREVVINRDTVRKATNGVKHAVDQATIERLPELLADPVAVLQSSTQPGSLVVILDAVEAGKGPVMAAVRPDKVAGRGLVVHEIASVYGRRAAEYSAMAADGRALYVRQKESPGSARDNGLQLPNSGSPSRGPSGTVLSEQDVVKLYQPADGGARGFVSFDPGARGGTRVFNIQLLAGADLSTFLHEGAHAFLEIAGDLAQDTNAPEQVRADYAKVLAYLGVDSREQIGVEQHEVFARSFEAYTREGAAPSSALRRAFARFKVWLTALYRSATQLDVALTDEVRGVFDRMLASDAEIAQAREATHLAPLIADALAVGMTAAEYASYRQAVEDARSEAEASLAREVYVAQQTAEKALRGQARRALHAQVLAETREVPAYRARRWLREGKQPDGSPVPEPLKLDKDAMLDEYGQSFLRHLTGMYRLEGGVHPDEAAALLGFASGGELVHALVNAPPLQAVVKAETERRLAERYPDPLTDGSLADRALRIVHTGKQAAVLLREVNALERVSGKAPTQAHVLREVARQLIADKRVRRLAPESYRVAEVKAGREAFEAAATQDWPAAAAGRRRQLLNHLLYREARAAEREVTRAHRLFKRLQSTKTRATLGKAGADYLEQIDGLLERFDLRQLSGKASDRRLRLAQWIEAKRADGVPVDLPPALVDEAFTLPWRELTVEQVRQLRDAVTHLTHLANTKNRLLLAREQRDREAVDAAMADSVAGAHAARGFAPGLPSLGDRAHGGLMEFRAIQGAATDLARELDGFVDGGAVWANTVGVIRDAVSNDLNPALLRAQEDLARHYQAHYSHAELRRLKQRITLPELGTWTKESLLSLALNWGNEGNRTALLTQAKGRLAPAQVGQLLSRLDARDWAFVQGVWDRIDAHWPAIAEAHKRRTGLVPKKVESAPFAMPLPDGSVLQIRGGYYPLKYEADSVQSMKDAAADLMESLRLGRVAKAATRDGHTLERVGSGGRRVRLDLGVLDAHLREVLRDIHLGDAVNYVHTVLHGPKFGAAVSGTGTLGLHKGLDFWLRDVATGEMTDHVVGAPVARFLRTSFTGAVLTYKVTSALLQLTGVAASLSVLGPDLHHGIRTLIRYPRRSYAYVQAASPMMAARLVGHADAVLAVANARSSAVVAGRAAMLRYGYWMMGRVQSLVDTATWLAAEKRGLVQFAGDVAQARAYADDVVTRAQGSQEFIDKTPLQRGTLGDTTRQSEYIKALSALSGYMLAKGNRLYEVTRTTNFRRPEQALTWGGHMVLLLVLEQLVAAAIRGKLSDEDDDGYLDEVAEWLADEGPKEASMGVLGSIPGLNAVAGNLRGYGSSGIVGGLLKAWHDVYQQFKPKDGEWQDIDTAAQKSAVKAVGYSTGLPSGAINTTLDAWAVDDRDVAPYEYLTGPRKPD